MTKLSKEQIIKKTYLQLGDKFNLSKDLILYLYNLVKDDSEIRIFHTNCIYRNTLYIDATHANFKDYLPINQGVEWAIKWKIDKLLNDIHLKIKVIGEEDYLYKNYSYMEDGMLHIKIKEAPIQLKLKYINLSPSEEILEDYLNFLSNDRNYLQSILIDPYGEAYYTTPIYMT